jgi:hypothetical protein
MRLFQPAAYELLWDMRAATHGNAWHPGTALIRGTITQNHHTCVRLHAAVTTIAIKAAVAHMDSVPGPVALQVAHGCHAKQSDGDSHGDGDALMLTLPGSRPWPVGRVVLRLEFEWLLHDNPWGLYRSTVKGGGDPAPTISGAASQPPLHCSTQFEATSARTAFPCVDEPDAKAVFHVRVLTPPGWRVLGNMPCAASAADGGGVLHSCAATPAMSTYLVALAACSSEADLVPLTTDTVKAHAQPLVVTVWGRAADAASAEARAAAAHALTVALASLRAMAALTGHPYSLPKLDLVSVAHFDSGAMENWGLCLFQRDMLLGPSRAVVTNTVAHEVAHQWFGNLVTMRSWDLLWLNEAFATVMASWIEAALELTPDPGALTASGWQAALGSSLVAWQNFLSRDVASALHTRAVTPHPGTVVTEADIDGLFDAATYVRGGAVLRAMLLLQGPVALLGLRRYIASALAPPHNGLTQPSVLWEAVGPSAAAFVQAWLAVPGAVALEQGRVPVLVPGPAGVPFQVAAASTWNCDFAVPGLVPLPADDDPAGGAMALAQLTAACAADPGAAICLVLSAKAAVNGRASALGWALVHAAAQQTQCPSVQALAKRTLGRWSTVCRLQGAQRGMATDDALRALVAVAVQSKGGKFAAINALQGVLHYIGSTADVTQWRTLLQGLTRPRGVHGKVPLPPTVARAVLAEVEGRKAAAVKACAVGAAHMGAATLPAPPAARLGGRSRSKRCLCTVRPHEGP